MIEAAEFNNRNQWLGQRRKYIGSSDAAGIFGCGYANQTRHSVWLSKVDSVEAEADRQAGLSDEDRQLMADGAANEFLVIEAFKKRNTDFAVVSQSFDFRTNPKYPNLCASLDAYGITPDGLEFPIEAKWILNPSRKVDGEWVDEWDDGRCPLKYQFQVLHQMIVMDVRRGVVVAFVRGKYRERWIDWDDEAVKWMLSEYETFWQHVENKTHPPEPTPIELEIRTVDRGTARIVGSDVSEKIREMDEIQSQIATKKSRLEVLSDYVVRRIGSSEYVMLDDGNAAKIHKQSVRLMRKLPSGVKLVD